MPRPPQHYKGATPPPSPADQWAAQQLREAREKALMNRIIGVVVLVILVLIGLVEHWITLPF